MNAYELIEILNELPEDQLVKEILVTYDSDCALVGIMGLYVGSSFGVTGEENLILEGDS